MDRPLDRSPSTLIALALALLASPACDDKHGTGGDADAGDTAGDEVSAGDTLADGEVWGDGDAEEALDDPGPDVVDEPVPPCVEQDSACVDAACHAPPFGPLCVGGTVVDGAGAPVVDHPVVACASSVCYFGRTGADGWFAVNMPRSDIHSIAIYFPGLPVSHSPFCEYEALCDGPLNLCETFVLRAAPAAGDAVPVAATPSDPAPLTADIRVEADDGAAIVLPAGSEVKLPIGVEPFVALTRYPLEEDLPCFVDPANPPLALWVVTPIDAYVIEPGTRLDPVLVPAGLDLPNETGWGLAAGAAVDVYVLGGAHPAEAGLAEGEWTRVAGATVSGDGTRIRTASGEGLSYLTWFAIYAP